MPGSPPHAWGRLLLQYMALRLQRFTPTCVGKAARRWERRSRPRFTPTCVGKAEQFQWRHAFRIGSPPHAWGRPTMRMALGIKIRFTPTCVRKADPRLWTFSATAVHPHMRGEGIQTVTLASFEDGSPPHAWGRPARRPPIPVGDRFTPTCVGKAVPHTLWIIRCSVHPHMRGEGEMLDKGLVASYGSPPHAWGRPVRAHMQGGAQRFTPTCVGKASSKR